MTDHLTVIKSNHVNNKIIKMMGFDAQHIKDQLAPKEGTKDKKDRINPLFYVDFKAKGYIVTLSIALESIIMGKSLLKGAPQEKRKLFAGRVLKALNLNGMMH